MPLFAWIPLLPLASFALLILLGRRLAPLVAGWVSVAALASSGVLTFLIGPEIWHGHSLSVRWAWLSARDSLWTIGLAVDGLSWVMLAVVTLIGTMIQCYSIGYMRDDARFCRFFAYLSLFCASMLTLVLADHFLLLYAGWELVGLCSYLLISFWFEKPAAANAGRKAFLTTRIGDTGLLAGILLLAFTAGDLQFGHLELIRARMLLQHREALLTLISVLIFFGAVGKSAQIPLHVWLPDAMEGPTPVSALIHAATMVAAGVYLIARTLPLFTPESLRVVLVIGLATHLLAGTVALTMTDIKRVLAYSTISQLGLMMTALGLGVAGLAMFHLVTHAFFKALLFLGAGSVIHATHQQDMSRLGGLRRAMPLTWLTCLIATLAMSGVPGLSGFWSKDAILLEAHHQATWVFWCLVVGAVITASYVFRLYLRCFHGPAPHYAGHLPHESPAVMTVPLLILALGAAFIGLLGSPLGGHWLLHVLGLHEAPTAVGVDPVMMGLSALIVSLGVVGAWRVGMQHRPLLPPRLGGVGDRLYHWASHKYFVDELYDRAIIQPFLRATQQLAEFDRRVIDGAVDRAGLAGASLAQFKAWVDQRIVDRLVNGVAELAALISAWGRRLQTGLVHQYLFVVVVSVVVLSFLVRQ